MNKNIQDKNIRDISFSEKTNTLVGTRQRRLVDEQTGEVMEVTQTTKLRYGSTHFWKCYMKKFLEVMKSLNSKQFKVFIYIIEHTNSSTNQFVGTYDKIVKDTMYWSSFLVTLCSEIMLYIETPLVSYSYSLNEVSHSCTS